uniref:Tc1-like transposase DDE domain-containing protein n=1 Tax=Physcomitrium patens TaxID=3218 RepID=A0A2K1L7U5_PHYPA|nr:hypothetical protein PHYPA_000539 [Physcomitrium patens]
MAEVEGRMDAKQFVEISEKNLLPSIEEFGIFEKEVIFQQDKNPKHNSKLAWKSFDYHGIKIMDWSAKSLDHKSTEYLLDHLKY